MILETMKRPKMDTRGRAVNPDEQKALRTYQAIYYLVKQGRTEAEAIAFYGRPIGVCECGQEAKTKRGRVCQDCYNKQARERQAERRAAGGHITKKLCQVCKRAFMGGPDRLNCPAHANMRVNQRSDKGIQRTTDAPKMKAVAKTAPTPHPHEKYQGDLYQRKAPMEEGGPIVLHIEPVRPVDVKALGIEVKRIPALGPSGLRNLLPRDGEATRTAVD